MMIRLLMNVLTSLINAFALPAADTAAYQGITMPSAWGTGVSCSAGTFMFRKKYISTACCKSD